MILQAFLSFLLLIGVVTTELSFLASFPEPIRSFPLVLLFGVLIAHFVRPNVGCIWMIIGGILLDLMGTPGHLITFAYSSAGLTGVLLQKKVFTNRSFYAMMGLGLSMDLALHLANGAVLLIIDPSELQLRAPLIQVFLFAFVLALTFIVSRRLSRLLQSLFLIRTS